MVSNYSVALLLLLLVISFIAIRTISFGRPGMSLRPYYEEAQAPPTWGIIALRFRMRDLMKAGLNPKTLDPKPAAPQKKLHNP